jgi:hypothetical protein
VTSRELSFRDVDPFSQQRFGLVIFFPGGVNSGGVTQQCRPLGLIRAKPGLGCEAPFNEQQHRRRTHD